MMPEMLAASVIDAVIGHPPSSDLLGQRSSALLRAASSSASYINSVRIIGKLLSAFPRSQGENISIAGLSAVESSRGDE